MRCAFHLLAVCAGPILAAAAAEPPGPGPDGPCAIATAEGDRLVVACERSRRVRVVDAVRGAGIRSIPLPAPPGGLVVRGATAYVSAADPAGRVLAVDLDSGAVRGLFASGHMPGALALSPDGRTLCVANRFENRVRIVDLASGRQRPVEVVREPVALAVSPDGARLYVANHLPEVRPFLDDEFPEMSAEVSVVDLREGRVTASVELPNGSQGLRGLAVSPDGRHVAVTHVLSRYTAPAWRIDNGAMNRNAVSLLDAAACRWIATVILDDPDRGAANPWAVAFDGAGRRLFVAHAGTHEMSVVDVPALLARLAAGPRPTGLPDDGDPALLDGIRTRVRLPLNGPRALAERDGVVHVAGFFSDSLVRVDLRGREPSVAALPGPAAPAASPAWTGERCFHDATLCRGQWQSCASCHPDGRSDALYWDLLNDGVGNTKNTKSLLLSVDTPPVMWRGVRGDAATAVRAGIRHIQFVEPDPGQVAAIKAWLRSMRPVPSPALDASRAKPLATNDASCARCHEPGAPVGGLTDAARRGRALFLGRAGCVACHPPPLYTNLQTVDPGLGSGVAYDVPSLIEAWRTAPYLHGGDALTLRETVTGFNPLQVRGRTADLAPGELDDLLEFLRSL